jgi:hypothetical protein
LFFDLTADPRHISIHFRDSAEVEETLPELRNQNIAIMEIDGSSITTREDLFKAFAIARQKPKGWYGDEEYAHNRAQCRRFS